jgi:hypothetical protein
MQKTLGILHSAFFIQAGLFRRPGGPTAAGSEDMPLVMMLYYVICLLIAGMLVWNFAREKDDRQMMLLYLIVLVPLVLRILRID